MTVIKNIDPATRIHQMLRVDVSKANIVKRLCSEFTVSFYQQGESIFMVAPDSAGRMVHRCIYNNYS